MAKVSEFLPCAPGGPEPHTPDCLPYRPMPLPLFDPMRFCSECSKETEWLVNDGVSRMWEPRCSRHKLFGVI
jgi:hypothetical protein